jgi:Zn-dependent M28 family amino/carboxypeptidase
VAEPNEASSPKTDRAPNRVTLIVAAALLTAVIAYLGGRALTAAPASTGSLQRAVTATAVTAHLRELDAIARDSGNTRFTGSDGYERSVDYVIEVLTEAGLDVHTESFSFYSFAQRSPTTLRIVDGARFEDGIGVNAMMYSASAEVSAPLVAIDFERGPGSADGPACDRDAFDEEPVDGAIVLIQPGPCLYRDQVRNTARAGAAAVIFAFSSDRLFRPTLFTPEGIEIPVLAVTDEVGLELFEADGSRVELKTDIHTKRSRSRSVIAETTSGDPDDVIMVGAHLDSVLDGPGINDNGSGSASILELARQIAGRSIENRVRFAFWGGEELGLLGSTAYVEALPGDERDAIAAYLNFDMIASPNFVRFVYSADGAPRGSDEIAQLFFDYFDDHALISEELDLQGRSDHGPFMAADIPVGGLFTGAEDPKSAEEADLFGGELGRPHDPCYHQACDTLENVDRGALDEMADAIAHVVGVLAMRADPI